MENFDYDDDVPFSNPKPFKKHGPSPLKSPSSRMPILVKTFIFMNFMLSPETSIFDK